MSTGKINFDELNVGDPLPELKKDPVTEVQLVKYAGASGDFNPLHTVDAVGKQAGFGGVIAHGMLLMGFMGQAVTTWIERKNLKKFSVRFVAPTKPNEAITVTGKVKDKRQENSDNIIAGDISAANEAGEVKATGYFEAVV